MVIVVAIVMLYAIVQLLYTGYYLRRSRALVSTTFVGLKTLGSGPRLKFWVDGDSLGAGIGASSFETSLAGRLAVELAKQHTVTLTNRSHSGARLANLLNSQPPAQKQEIILLVISSNDLLHATDLSSFSARADKVLQKYSPLANQVVVIGPGNVGGSDLIPIVAWPYYRLRRPQYVNQWRQAIAKFPNAIYISPVDQPSSFTSQYNRATTSTDHFHLNDEGYRWWADLVIQALAH